MPGNAVELATAYVSLSVSGKDLKPQIAQSLGGAETEAAKAGKKAGFGFSKAWGVALLGAAGIAAGTAAALVKIGKGFEESKNAIIVGTGASGKALEGLQGSAKKIAKNVPSDIATVGSAVADVNTRLGLTGGPLEDVTSKFLNLSRITKTDVTQNIANATRVFGDWSIQAKDQPKALDAIFEATKRTGIGLDQLTTNVVEFGAPLRQFGFSFEESLSLFGKWEKEGVNTQVVLSGLKQGLGRFSKAGKDPQKELDRVTKAIKAAGSAGEANSIAIEAFGVRAGPDMAAAVREGRFELGDMVKGLENSGGAIDDADKRTRTFSDSWQLLQNRLADKVEPVATRVIDAINKGMDWLAKNAVPMLENMAKWIQQNAEWLVPVAAGIGAIVAAFTAWTIAVRIYTAAQAALNIVMSANPLGAVILLIIGLVAAIVVAWKRSETFRDVVTGVWDAIKGAVEAVINWITDVAWPAIQDFWNAIVDGVTTASDWVVDKWDAIYSAVETAVTWITDTAIPAIGKAWDWVVDKVTWLWNAYKKYWTFIWDLLKTVLRWLKDTLLRGIQNVWDSIAKATTFLWEKGIKPAFDLIKKGAELVWKGFETMRDNVGDAWEKIQDLAKKPVKFVIETVINKGLIAGFNWLSDKIGGPHVDPIKLPAGFARGGVLPGYTPGRDVHRFYSPTAGYLDLSGGEAIMRPEFTRMVGGPRGVSLLNSFARRHGYAGGGVLDWLKNAGSWLWDKASSIYKAVTNPMEYLKRLIPNIPGGTFISEVAGGVKDRLIGAAVAKVKALWNAIKGTGVTSGATDWRSMWNVVHALLPNIMLTSGYRPGAITALGNVSRHALGRAIDVAPGSMHAFNVIKAAFPNAKELFYSPANGRTLLNGKPWYMDPITLRDHWDHIHLGMANGGVVPKPLLFDNGGVLPPGTSLVHNGTGAPEPLVPGGGDNYYVTVEVRADEIGEVQELIRIVRDARVTARKTEHSGMVTA